MDAPLWTERYAPDLADLPQSEVREYLQKAVDDPINLVIHGPAGAGKTAAVRALAREAHEDPDNDLVEINVADFFGMTKKEIANDPRFSSFIDSKRKRNSSKADLINHVLKESASYSPVSGTYKTVVLDNAEAIREDFQQALRRVMERHHEATQFIITTRQPTKLIPPIKSRCFPVAMHAPSERDVASILKEILEQEGSEYDYFALQILARDAGMNIREAILSAQTLHEKEGEVTTDTIPLVREIGIRERIEEMLDDAEAGDFQDARKTLDDLLVDEGYSGEEVLHEILDVVNDKDRYTGKEQTRAELTQLAGEIDMDLAEGSSDRVHLGHLLAELGSKGEA
ncbi:AAA family ATPase [Halorussus lipolyticus]|uniref:AAA family ATPase n=1 Tax=Halorussus lipolyticus TaxID=3034024 RepID=UPI0023E8CF21|nr:AAA family ATPase [Halorussus sp. DT80]